MRADGRGVSLWASEHPDPAVTVSRSAPARCPRDIGEKSQVELAGGAFGDQARALNVAAHGAQVAMPRVAHDVLVAHPLVIGLGDEADAQRMRAQPLEPV